MPVSHEYKTIFVHIPKTAGTSIEEVFNCTNIENLYSTERSFKLVLPYNFKTSEIKDTALLKTPQHLTLSELKDLLPHEVYTNYYKFCVVRNPYKRLASEYFYRLNTYFITRTSNFYIPSFEVLVNKLNLPQKERIIDFDGHLELQSNYINEDINDIFYYEQIDVCFNKIFSIKQKEVKIPHKRKNPFSKPYQELYTPELQEKVYNFYKEDFIRFGYDSKLD